MLSHPYTAKEEAELFIFEVVKVHGFLELIVSNRDKVFLSNFGITLFKAQGTQLDTENFGLPPLI